MSWMEGIIFALICITMMAMFIKYIITAYHNKNDESHEWVKLQLDPWINRK